MAAPPRGVFRVVKSERALPQTRRILRISLVDRGTSQRRAIAASLSKQATSDSSFRSRCRAAATASWSIASNLYFGPELHYCGFYRSDCCHRIPCTRPHDCGKANCYLIQKSHDFGFRDSTKLNGKYLIQYRSPIPRLQSNYDLAVSRRATERSNESFANFAERETAYFINFYRSRRRCRGRTRPRLLTKI